jgi:hypothetical protein
MDLTRQTPIAMTQNNRDHTELIERFYASRVTRDEAKIVASIHELFIGDLVWHSWRH